jgi:GDPmannose 4,6-dehydratase
MSKIAFITGISGQDGSYLAELLLDKGYIVWGIIRRTSYSTIPDRIKHISHLLNLRYGDLNDGNSLLNTLIDIKKHIIDIELLEVYNLGAMSDVKLSFEIPEYTSDIDGMGTLRLLESLRTCGIPLNKIKYYQACTSELYGQVAEVPQTENTPFYPCSPYGASKLYAYWITKIYRKSYNIFACCGILFNHESSRRGPNFVTRKITLGLNELLKNDSYKLTLGNLYSLRDWGHAKDYVYGMWLIMQQEEPDDYVLATNQYHTVKEFAEKAFKLRGYELSWKGEGLNEIGYDMNTGRELINVSKKYFRPNEVDELLGNSTKAYEKLGWNPSITFDELVKEMVDADCC